MHHIMIPQYLAMLAVVVTIFATMSDSLADRSITEALQPFVDRHELAGAVALVADKDRVLSLNCVGFADIESQMPMQPETMFWIASQTKPITATAFMIAMEEFFVHPYDSVEKYFPEFAGQMVIQEQDDEHVLLKKSYRPITIRDILTHTSGLPFSSAMEYPTLDVLPLRDRVRSYSIAPLLFQPGTRYSYSNEGINIVGQIIETVAEEPYEHALDRYIFEPLGMDDTTFYPTRPQTERLATSYKPNAENNGLEPTQISQLEYPLYDGFRQSMPAGGLFSTATDIAHFCQMILNEGYVSETLLSEAFRDYGAVDDFQCLTADSVKEMTSRQTPPQLAESYGFGWAVGDGWCGHGGAQSTNMTIDFKRGLAYVWMVQHAGFPGDGARSQEAFRKAADARFGTKVV